MINDNYNNKDKKNNQTITKIKLTTKGQKQYNKRFLNDIFNI